jgi:hypothetical protein
LSVSEYIVGRLERGYVILSGRNCSLVKIKRKALVEISKSISISLYFALALRIPIAILLWYKTISTQEVCSRL